MPEDEAALHAGSGQIVGGTSSVFDSKKSKPKAFIKKESLDILRDQV